MPDAFQINHETIYTALCVICMSELRRQTLERLPHDHKSRQPRGAGLKVCVHPPRRPTVLQIN